MAANLEDQLIDKVRALPPNKQQEALRLLDTLASGAGSEPNGAGVDRRPIWEGDHRPDQRGVARRHVGERTNRRVDQSRSLPLRSAKSIGGPRCGFQRSN